jgi:hypothetical protein
LSAGASAPTFTSNPYYGDEDETKALYFSQAKRGTTTFHAYATLYARVRNKRYSTDQKEPRSNSKYDENRPEQLEYKREMRI